MLNQRLKVVELLSLSLRTFRTRPQRAFFTILGMAVGIGTVLLLVSLGYGLQYILIGKLITTQDSLITMEASYPTESNLLIDQPLVDKLKTYQDVAEVSPVAEFPGEISENNGTGLLVNTLIVQPTYFRLTGILPDKGAIPTNSEPGSVVYSQTLIPLGLLANETTLDRVLSFKVIYEDIKNNTTEEVKSLAPIKIKGIITDVATSPTAIIFADSISKAPPFYNKVLVKAKNADVLISLRNRLLGEGFSVSARIDLVTQARKITNILTIILGVFGVTALIVSAIGMFNTMLVGFMERTYEVGILKSLGATDYDVRNLFLVEASAMGLFGGIGGIVIGVGLGKIFNTLLSFVATKFGGQSIQIFLTPWWFVFLILALSILIGFLSGWWPAHKATGLSPKEAFTKK
ncbi:MAG: FtsX-like permease family protein [Candidatus Paceibacterota bacterium]